MAWDTDAVDILRVMMDDFDNPTERISDDRYLSVAIVGAFQVLRELTFDTTYTVNISAQSISPDPEDDGAFMNLTILKAAVILAQGEAVIAGNRAIAVKDGSSSVDLRELARWKMELLKQAKLNYESAKKEYLQDQAGVSRTGATTAGAAILTPFRQYARTFVWGRNSLNRQPPQ